MRWSNFSIPESAELEEFLEAFDEEKQRHTGEISPGVFRGKGPILSAYLEDLFAVYLKKAFDSDSISVLVDVSMKIGSVSCRPDIIVTENKDDGFEVLGFIDCKTSLGWHRSGVHEMAQKYFNLRELVVKNDYSVYLGGIDEKSNGSSRFDGTHSVKSDFAWDVFVKDVWGKGSEQTVLKQIESWNSKEASRYSMIWWGQHWSEKKEGIYARYPENVFTQLADRMKSSSNVVESQSHPNGSA